MEQFPREKSILGSLKTIMLRVSINLMSPSHLIIYQNTY